MAESPPIPPVERFSVFQRGTVPVTTWVDAFAWVCDSCGWLGTGHTSATAAEREARRHWTEEHPGSEPHPDVTADSAQEVTP